MIPRQSLFDAAPSPEPLALLPAPEDPPQHSRRQDGWSAANQRRFLEAIAEGAGVEAACRSIGLSAASAYAFRRTAKGAAFALGWRAASLVAREAIAETLLVRALEGQVDTYVRADGTQVTRHRHDNRLAMSLLARLDRQVEAAADADVKAALLVAQEFPAYLDLVTRDEGPARAGLFLARRAGQLADDDESASDLAPIYALATADRLVRTGVATAAEVPVDDLDPTRRAAWTAEQWARAEAAGLLRLALPEPEPKPERDPELRPDPETAREPQLPQHWPRMMVGEDEDTFTIENGSPVWWDSENEGWLTCFPPPDDFDGYEDQERDHVDYVRDLSDDEVAVMGAGPDRHPPSVLAALSAGRELFFAQVAASRAAPRSAHSLFAGNAPI